MRVNARYINSTRGASSKKDAPQWHIYPTFQAHSTTQVCTGIRQNQSAMGLIRFRLLMQRLFPPPPPRKASGQNTHRKQVHKCQNSQHWGEARWWDPPHPSNYRFPRLPRRAEPHMSTVSTANTGWGLKCKPNSMKTQKRIPTANYFLFPLDIVSFRTVQCCHHATSNITCKDAWSVVQDVTWISLSLSLSLSLALSLSLSVCVCVCVCVCVVCFLAKRITHHAHNRP